MNYNSPVNVPKPPRPNDTYTSYNVDTVDIAGINKKADQRLQQLNNFSNEPDEDLAKLDRLLANYAG